MLQHTWDKWVSSFRSQGKALVMLHLSAKPAVPCTKKLSLFCEYCQTFGNISIYSVRDVQIFLIFFFLRCRRSVKARYVSLQHAHPRIMIENFFERFSSNCHLQFIFSRSIYAAPFQSNHSKHYSTNIMIPTPFIVSNWWIAILNPSVTMCLLS